MGSFRLLEDFEAGRGSGQRDKNTMNQAQAQSRYASPLFSVWHAPGDTIERIIAGNPKRHVLGLAALAGVLWMISHVLDIGAARDIFHWKIALLVIVVGCLVGIINLYLCALLLAWAGKLVRGRASALQIRAVIAWAFVPLVASLLILVMSLAGLAIVGVDTTQTAQIVAGIFGIWSVIAMIIMLSRVQGFGPVRAVLNFVLGVIFLFGVSLLIRTFLFEPFNMPSGSMEPTLLIGDQFFASKFSYGYTRYSLPFSPPLFSGRLFSSVPRRGDVVVFRTPNDDSVNHVKRVVGIPGDRIQLTQGVLSINGAQVKREQLDDFVGDISCPAGPATRAKRWREVLDDGTSYETVECADPAGGFDTTEVYTVPPGQYFVMGDNRNNSLDSRMRNFGTIPLDHMIGRATIIFLSAARGDHASREGIRFNRLGRAVR